MTDLTYDGVVECRWLEDKGNCSRHLIEGDFDDGHGVSAWVCHDCCTVLEEDPIEHECEEYGLDSDELSDKTAARNHKIQQLDGRT